MDSSNIPSEVEQEKRLRIIEMLLPLFGSSVEKLLEAATLVQEHVSGHPAEVCLALPRKDDVNHGLERAYKACRSGSA